VSQARRKRDRAEAGGGAKGVACEGSGAVSRRIGRRSDRRYSYAATRRFCFTNEEVERLPEDLAPLRFGLSDWFRFKLSCNTFTRSTTLVARTAGAGFPATSLCCAFCS